MKRAVAAVVLAGAMALTVASCKTVGATPGAGVYTIHIEQALRGHVHPLPPGWAGPGWIGDDPPGADWEQVGTVPSGPWEGATVWKGR